MLEVAVPSSPMTANSNDWGAALNAGGVWHLLYTKSRQEKQLSTELTAMGVASFLPLVKHIRNYRQRRSTVDIPLFPGYVFVLGSLDEAYRADRTGRVVQIIRVSDQRRLLWELENLRLALGNDAALKSFPFLREGKRVQVREGPFRGLQGVIESCGRANRLVLQVEMLASAASLEIDGALLDPL